MSLAGLSVHVASRMFNKISRSFDFMPSLEVIDEHIVLDILSSTVRLVGSLLPNNIEVVLHDLRNPECSVVEISSPSITKKSKSGSGSAHLPEPMPDSMSKIITPLQ